MTTRCDLTFSITRERDRKSGARKQRPNFACSTKLIPVYVSGQGILYKQLCLFCRDRVFQTTILLQDPYEELAERLLVLSKIRQTGASILGVRESMEVASALDFAEQLPFNDEKAMRRALREMPADVGIVFANPLTRQLTAATPDEMPTGGAISTALNELSSFALVGLRHESDKFLSALAELIGVETSLLYTVSAPISQCSSPG